MARNGLLIGEVAAKSGVSRKALRLYETAGILPPTRRTASGYRTYGPETLAILAFVAPGPGASAFTSTRSGKLQG